MGSLSGLKLRLDHAHAGGMIAHRFAEPTSPFSPEQSRPTVLSIRSDWQP